MIDSEIIHHYMIIINQSLTLIFIMNKEPKPKEITFLIATDVHLGHN